MDERLRDIESDVATLRQQTKQHWNTLEKQSAMISEHEKQIMENKFDHVKLMQHQTATEIAIATLSEDTKEVLANYNKLLTKIMIALVVLITVVPEARDAVIGILK